MILAALVVVIAVRLCYWFYFFSTLSKYQVDKKQHNDQPVSVIICTKNGLKDLKSNLQHILSQQYQDYEVIVVDDFSTDATLQYLAKVNDDKLSIVSCEVDRPGKKAALTTGISVAKNDLILVTDVDCKPRSKTWIASMVAHTSPNRNDLVLGYGPMTKSKGLVNLFSRFETVMTAIQYLSYALKKMPYMGVGRNMMYSKRLFTEAGGFKSHEHIASGDDDLFVSAISTNASVSINLEARSFMDSSTPLTWRGLLRQKARHISTSTSYGNMHQVLLGVYSGTHIVHYILLVTLLITGKLILPVLSHLVFLLLTMVIFRQIARKLDDEELLARFPLFDMLMALYYVVLATSPFYTKRNTWN